MRRVLIVGAGIAGDVLAVMLDRASWAVTVVEVAPVLRSGGQIVDLRNGSAGVLRRLGLLQQVEDVLIPQAGMAWVDGQGRHLAEMPVAAFGGRGFVSDKELARTDLAAVIHAAGSEEIRYRFGDTVTEISDNGHGETVTFRSGDTERFDLVVGADGVHSRVRALRFGPESRYRHSLGVVHAWFTTPETASTPDLAGWFELHNAPGARVVGVRPGHPLSQEVGFSLPAVNLPAERRNRDVRLRFLEREFADVGWRTPEFLTAARQAEDFAMDTGDQIRMAHWRSGRVVLLGDSAWCAAPLSGLGTALALKGAEALAHRLTEYQPDFSLDVALDRYERDMRPVVTAAQRLLPGRVRTFAPRTRFGIRSMTTAMRTLQRRPIQTVVGALSATTADAQK